MLASQARNSARSIRRRQFWPSLPLLFLSLCETAGAANPAAGSTAEALDTGSHGQPGLPNVVLIVVDTLRADRLSAYGNPAPTSPHIDALLSAGARFETARTVEPLTAPATASMLTSLYPHEHGSSRNGLPVRPGLRSLPAMLARLGYVTVAFVSNWTLAEEQSGLAEHFDVYQEVFTKKRWLFWFGESDAEDVRSAAAGWVEEVGTYPGQPLFLWAHFVEPHAPYKLQEAFAEGLGIEPGEPTTPRQRYDTEVAAADAAIGKLLEDLRQYLDPANTLYIFTSDHGEGLGEHGYKGHGRHLYEEELRIPLGFSWPGRILPGVRRAPASLIDIAPTVLGLLEAPSPPEWRGYDWSRVLFEGGDGPLDRTTYFQAHKGVVLRASGDQAVSTKRRRGLLQIGFAQGGRKVILDVENGRLQLYDLTGAGAATAPPYAGIEPSFTSAPPGRLPDPLRSWKAEVEEGLAARDRSPPPRLSQEALEKLKSLGYTN